MILAMQGELAKARKGERGIYVFFFCFRVFVFVCVVCFFFFHIFEDQPLWSKLNYSNNFLFTYHQEKRVN